MAFPRTHQKEGLDPESQLKLVQADLDDWKAFGVTAVTIIKACRGEVEPKP